MMADRSPDGRPAPEDRLSDGDRQRAVELLQRHTSDGRLTLDEFSDRVGEVYAARSRAEVEPLFADLPVRAEPAVETRRRRATRWVVAVMSGAKRTGRWRAGDHVNVVAVMGGCHLDLRQAEIDGPDLTIMAVAIMGGIRIDVPEGIEVSLLQANPPAEQIEGLRRLLDSLADNGMSPETPLEQREQLIHAFSGPLAMTTMPSLGMAGSSSRTISMLGSAEMVSVTRSANRSRSTARALPAGTRTESAI